MTRRTGTTASLAAALLASVAAPALAGGIERSTQSLGILFEPGRVVELGFARVSPDIQGTDAAVFGGRGTGDVAGNYSVPSLSYKQDFTANLSGAIIIDTPLGLDLAYPLGGSVALGGTNASVNTTAVTGVVRYRADSGFGAHAGLRYQTSEADVELLGAAFPGISGYRADFDSDAAVGWLAGISWEKPEIAARVSLTYNSHIKHDFGTTETGPLIDPDGPGPLPALPLLSGSSTTEVKTPRSWNLEFQTGVAPDTLVFGSVRWVKWSEFKVDPARFFAIAGEGLVDLDDTTTVTLGVGRKLTDNWTGLASVMYETKSDRLVSPLAPYDGRKGVTLGAVYTQGNVKVTGGVSYIKLGNADTRPDIAPPSETGATYMRDNDAIGFGLKVAYSF